MQKARAARRIVLIALTLLSACAASGPSAEGAGSVRAFGNFLAGRFAMAEGDMDTAATDLLKVVAEDPTDPDVLLQAFIACLHAGRPEAVRLARLLPDSQVAQLLLADADAKAGRWLGAQQRFQGLQRQGVVQVLQPLLVAWAQQGDGKTELALAGLRPFTEAPRLRGLFALHAAMIADLGGRAEEAARLYRLAGTEIAEPNLRLAQIMASWQARNGQPGEAQRTLAALTGVAPDMGIAMGNLLGAVTKRPVGRAAEGMAEAYFTFAAMLRGQDSNELALVMLRLALDLRPDLAAARVLAADILAGQKHAQAAQAMLAGVASADPISPVARLRHAGMADRAGRSEEAMAELGALAREHPDSPLPHAQMGDVLRGKERFGEAVSAYDAALERTGAPSGSDWVLFYNRGVAQERAHRWPLAEADLKRALELAPDQPFVLNYLGYSWADMGLHLPEAKQMLQRAAARRPDDGAITDSLGWVLFREGDARGAVRLLERAAQLEPEDSTINGHLGDVYWAVGRKIEAQYQWRRALTLNPSAEDKAKLEGKLGSGRADAVASGP
jgi:tetratricopeptide (TPR) repeat protein